MAAQLNPKHDALTRDKIRVSQLVNLLQANAEGKIELDAIRIRSIEILLRKALPDLSAVEHTGQTIQPFALIPEQIQDASRWESTFKPSLPKPDTEH